MLNWIKKHWKLLTGIVVIIILSILAIIFIKNIVEIIIGIGSAVGLLALSNYKKKENDLIEDKTKDEKVINNSRYSNYTRDGKIK
jgi:hypothetical protein